MFSAIAITLEEGTAPIRLRLSADTGRPPKVTHQRLQSALLIPLVLFLISATCWFLLKDTYAYSKDVA